MPKTIGENIVVKFGHLLEWSIQKWLIATGKTVNIDEVPWMIGPMSTAYKIGVDFYAEYAKENGLEIIENQKDAGLLEDFSILQSQYFDPAKVHPEVHRFYENTSCYKMDVWSQWFGLMQPFAKTLIAAVSREIEQFNLPLSPLEVSKGMSSRVIKLVDSKTGETKFTCWLRQAASHGKVIYAGFYTTCKPPLYDGICVKVVFPLPSGFVSVILKPEHQPDGSFKLISNGKKFGDAGYYRVHKLNDKKLKVKYLPLKEVIHVFVDKEGILRTDHELKYWGMKFLHLHYKMTKAETA
ncbi:MAG: hypothetical protein ACXWDO_11800 [Bacteroidia bacterium]